MAVTYTAGYFMAKKIFTLVDWTNALHSDLSDQNLWNYNQKSIINLLGICKYRETRQKPTPLYRITPRFRLVRPKKNKGTCSEQLILKKRAKYLYFEKKLTVEQIFWLVSDLWGCSQKSTRSYSERGENPKNSHFDNRYSYSDFEARFSLMIPKN